MYIILTTGPIFWRSAKKIRCVSAEDYSTYTNIKKPGKGVKRDRPDDEVAAVLLSKLEEKIDTKANHLEKITSLERQLKMITDCFTCLVCLKKVCVWPAVVSPCCKVIIGCEDCITKWLDGESTCPHCRALLTLDVLVKVPYIRTLADALGSVLPISKE